MERDRLTRAGAGRMGHEGLYVAIHALTLTARPHTALHGPPTIGRTLIILGLILLVIGLVASIPILTTIGGILVVVGLVLVLLGALGKSVGGRKHFF